LSATAKLSAFLQTSASIHSHTGLVINEPEGKSNKSSGSSHSNTTFHAEGTRDFAPAAAMMHFSATSTASSTDQEATSSQQKNDSNELNIQSDVQSNAETNDANASGNSSNNLSLPVSVPVSAGNISL